MIQPNSSAAVLVFENVWATRLRDAIVGAGGRLVDNARIPAAVVDAAVEAMYGAVNDRSGSSEGGYILWDYEEAAEIVTTTLG